MLPEYAWVLTIMYIAFVWSYSVYLEQMFAAGLYLWHMKWERAVGNAQRDGTPIPSMRQIPQPSILDDVHELIEKPEMASQ